MSNNITNTQLNTMRKELFTKTIATAKFDIGNGITNFGFECKYGSSEITFCNDDQILIVENFGTMRNSKWVQSEPTETQLEVMQKMIDDKRANFPIFDDQTDTEFNECRYDYYGVSRADFY